jgi:hypothetical protein
VKETEESDMTMSDEVYVSQHYEIRLKGHLDGRRLRYFEGFEVVLLPNGETILTGPIIDQAALHGILNRIRDMGMPLIELKQTSRSQGDSKLGA